MARNRELEADITEESTERKTRQGSKGSVHNENAPEAGPQVFGCTRCLERFDNYEKLQKHQREVHRM